MRTVSVISAVLLSSAPTFAAYNLVDIYAGGSFFNNWKYEDGYDDTTHGAVNWLSQSAAQGANLTFVNDAGNFVIKIDNTTNIPSAADPTQQLKRNSVSLSTNTFYDIGSVIVLDLAHVPVGCSVWPAFWTRAPNWPHGGEIDILESVNLMTTNRMTLHADEGCTQQSGATQRGKTVGANCAEGLDSSIGCTVEDTMENSFGEGFNKAGGGVWAVQFDATGIFIWFWKRSDAPADLTNPTKTVDPSDNWGTPAAAWPASSCNITNFFKPQQLVLDITLCGDFAGAVPVYNASGCTKPSPDVTPNTCYTDNVDGDGSNYAEAYFEINSVRVFSLNNTILLPTESGGSTVFNTATSLPNFSGAAAVRPTGEIVRALATVMGAAVVAAFSWTLV